MTSESLAIVYFFYGLAFFSMGLIVAVEGGRGSDLRLNRALRPLAAFGLIHGVNEWLEMFMLLGLLPGQDTHPEVWSSLILALLAFSFLSLSAFGASLLSSTEDIHRIGLLFPLAQVAIWSIGLLYFRGQYHAQDLWNVADVWTRYVIGIPAALIACVGLLAQQRAFRRAGMERFGRDSMWAAVAFAWYGVVGQTFTRISPLAPSIVVNQELFLATFSFPIQMLRAAAAVVVAIYVMRFMRAFEVETQHQIDTLQTARLEEAERRDALRGELIRQIVAAQEAERQRIARELHDETGQSLTALGLGLRGAASLLRVDIDKAAHNLRQLEGMAAQSLDELRRLISDLRPSHLDDLGLPAALRWYASEVEGRSDLKIHVDAPTGPCVLPIQIKTALFRVAQEALTNVIKHAEAQNAWIKIQRSEWDVWLEVWDDGRGFDPIKLSSSNHASWGLLGMEERVHLCGGQLNLESTPGKGTKISVAIPCHPTLDLEDEDENEVVISR